MRQEHLKYFVCPNCAGDLAITKVDKSDKGEIEEGQLHCSACTATYDIIRGIPRFVPVENYASSFGFEWNKHARTQYDSVSGANVSERRFFEETKWRRELPGETILEVGSGSGRFTEWAASTGAMVVSIDYSSAVEANYRSNGQKQNVLIAQADIYSLPVRDNFFDKVFCIGVLQHTPDVEKSFRTLIKPLKPNGSLIINVYRRRWRRYLSLAHSVRPIISQLSPDTLYRLCEKYVNVAWPIARLISKIPGGRYFRDYPFDTRMG